jgi:hypothetical protein
MSSRTSYKVEAGNAIHVILLRVGNEQTTSCELLQAAF